MCIKGLIVPIILFFHFYCVHTMIGNTSEPEVDIDRLFMSSRIMINKELHKVCSTSYSVTYWATYCKKAITFLKQKYNEYRNSIYLNYHPFSRRKSVICTPQTLLVPFALESSRVELTDQLMMPCFCRSAVESYKLPEDKYEFANEIAIYPSLSGNNWSIFKYNLEGYYTFHSWFPMVLKNEDIVPRSLLKMPPPLSITEGELLFHELRRIITKKQSNPKFQDRNVINVMSNSNFIKLCHVLYGRKDYADEVILPTTTHTYLHKREAKPFSLFIFVQGIKIIENDKIIGYECELYNRRNGEPTLDYKILPGLKQNTVLLAQKIEPYDSCLVRESIINVNVKYFDELF